jgi:hypothetical protein
MWWKYERTSFSAVGAYILFVLTVITGLLRVVATALESFNELTVA